MPIELLVLGLSVPVLLVHIVTQSQTLGRGRGQSWLMSPRDDQPGTPDRIAGRAARLSRNFQETYPAFVALALGLTVTNHTGGAGAVGALIWLGARIVYYPLYLTGAPHLRTYVWLLSIIGLLMMLFRFFV